MAVERQETGADRKHILIVDDDPTELKTLRYYLQESYKVTLISSGRTAVDFLTKYTPDLILLDYLMPVHNGAAVLKDIQSRVETKNIPVFFLTGRVDKESVTRVMPLRPEGYLLKNQPPQDIKKNIDGYFRKKTR